MEVSGQLHAPAALLPQRDHITHWLGGWVDPRASLEVVVAEKKSLPLLGIGPRS
jgi:hypothetical protein